VRFHSTPIKADRIWLALQEARSSDSREIAT
jgi:hypothetical protein